MNATTTYAADDASVNSIEKPSQGEQRVIVTYKNNVSEIIKDNIEKNGEVKQEFENVNAVSLDVPNKEIASLESNPNVASVETDKIVKASGTNTQVMSYGITNVNGPKVWDSGLTGKGIKVAVIDSGAGFHSDLNVAGGKSFVSYTTSFLDDNGHGTHVSGIIAAKNNDFGTVGIAPDAKIYALKALDSTGHGYNSDIIAAIDWAIANQMDVINMSLGGSDYSSAFEAAITKAYNSGIIIVASAGNDASTVEYPAKYSNAIAVSATDQTNHLAYFSNTGPEIEVAAPGVDITSLYKNNEYATMDGTSMASPFVAGILALYKQEYPQYTSSQLRAILDQNTIDLGTPGRDSQFGYGLVQAPVVTSSTSPQPDTPSNLRAFNATSTSVSLSWDNSGATTYRLVRNGQTVYQGSSTSFLDNTLTPHTYYQYQLYAISDGNVSKAATTSMISYPPTPKSPANFKASTIKSNSAVLSWGKSNDTTFYVLKRDNAVIYKGNSLIYSDTSLEPNKIYTYTVSAGNYGSSSQDSMLKLQTLNGLVPLNSYVSSTYSSYKKGSIVHIGVYSRHSGNIIVPWARFDVTISGPSGTVYKNTHYTDQNGRFILSLPSSTKKVGTYSVKIIMSKTGYSSVSNSTYYSIT